MYCSGRGGGQGYPPGLEDRMTAEVLMEHQLVVHAVAVEHAVTESQIHCAVVAVVGPCSSLTSSSLIFMVNLVEYLADFTQNCWCQSY